MRTSAEQDTVVLWARGQAGELRGYVIHIAEQGGQWYVWLMPGGQWMERCLRVGSLAEGAKLARERIEERLRRGR
jgi:hypothetical protein